METNLPTLGLAPYRRLVQMIWDPEPINDANLDLPVWCLGRKYKLGEGSVAHVHQIDSSHTPPASAASPTAQPMTKPESPRQTAPETPPDSVSSSFSSSLGYDEPAQANGWPLEFIGDSSSKIWMTYRSDFAPIPRSNDPKAFSSLSLSMRIKSHLMDQGGFTSDSGWGCMIRSGQSLLANAMALNELGRGKSFKAFLQPSLR
jgi:cysteine protease ATG4